MKREDNTRHQGTIGYVPCNHDHGYGTGSMLKLPGRQAQSCDETRFGLNLQSSRPCAIPTNTITKVRTQLVPENIRHGRYYIYYYIYSQPRPKQVICDAQEHEAAQFRNGP